MVELSHGICRMCHSVGSEDLRAFSEDPVIINEIMIYFSIRISVNDAFPKQICKECLQKLRDLQEFRQKVTANEELLISHAIKGCDGLNKYYLSLKNIEPDNKEINNVEDIDISDNNRPSITDIEEQDFKIESDCKDNKIKEEKSTDASVKLNSETEERSQSPENNTIDIESDFDTFNDFNRYMQGILENNDNKVITENIDNKSLAIIENVKNFKCLSCFECFESKVLLLFHYNTKHKSKEKKEKAKYLEIKENQFKCSECDIISETRENANKHLRIHNDDRCFHCKICGRTYATASEIARHGRAHDGSQVFCSYSCGYSTSYLAALIEHEKRHKKGEFKYVCEECGKGFQVKTWYEQHQNAHKGLKPYICDICGVAFHMDRYLTAHKSSVHPQTSKVKRYICTQCLLPCDSRKAFRKHMKEHGISTSFLCDICGKTLSNAEQLKFHKRVHLNVRPYSCSTCEKTFTKKFNLQLHEKTHTGEKSYACELCGKNYSQRSTLIRHNKRHHKDQKPTEVQCPSCNKSFPSRALLIAHSCS